MAKDRGFGDQELASNRSAGESIRQDGLPWLDILNFGSTGYDRKPTYEPFWSDDHELGDWFRSILRTNQHHVSQGNDGHS